MIEFAIYSPKRKKRWVLWIGHGAEMYGQIDHVSLTEEDLDNGQVTYARCLFRI